MLLLTRRPGQAIQVGEDIKIVLAEIKGKQARIGIDAPKEYQIDRDEVKTLKESEVTKYDPVRELHDRLGELFEFYQKWEDAEETGENYRLWKELNQNAAKIGKAVGIDYQKVVPLNQAA